MMYVYRQPQETTNAQAKHGADTPRRRCAYAWKEPVKYRSETYCWTQKLNRKDYGVDEYWVLFAVVNC
jgi:hypothetical protein